MIPAACIGILFLFKTPGMVIWDKIKAMGVAH